MPILNIRNVHASWQPVIQTAIKVLKPQYLDELQTHPNWLPGPKNIFNAFTLPLEKTRFILFGESPYPRPESANGYAFWDGAVQEIWSPSGLSKAVNRATSLRNLMKMLLIAEGALKPENTTQAAIAALDKQNYVQTLNELFHNLLEHGFLLLNASLVLHENNVNKDANHWRPFLAHILNALSQQKNPIVLILFGQIAKKLHQLPLQGFNQLVAEHPYNISFISNPTVVNFFKPFHLLLAAG